MAAHEVMDINGRRVIRVKVDQTECELNSIKCVFYDADCTAQCGYDSEDPRNTGDHILITEKDLPEYLTWRLTK